MAMANMGFPIVSLYWFLVRILYVRDYLALSFMLAVLPL